MSVSHTFQMVSWKNFSSNYGNCLGSWHWLQIYSSPMSLSMPMVVDILKNQSQMQWNIATLSQNNLAILCNGGKFAGDFLTCRIANVYVCWCNTCGIVFRVCLLSDWIQSEIAILPRSRFHFGNSQVQKIRKAPHHSTITTIHVFFRHFCCFFEFRVVKFPW